MVGLIEDNDVKGMKWTCMIIENIIILKINYYLNIL